MIFKCVADLLLSVTFILTSNLKTELLLHLSLLKSTWLNQDEFIRIECRPRYDGMALSLDICISGSLHAGPQSIERVQFSHCL